MTLIFKKIMKDNIIYQRGKSQLNVLFLNKHCNVGHTKVYLSM